MSTIVEIENLKKTIKKPGLRGSQVKVLKGISLKVETGSITAIIGLNGAGKSTTIKTLLGFIRPTSGRVELDATACIGYLPENPYYYDYLTLRELLWFSAKSFVISGCEFRRKAEQVAERVGMTAHLDQRLRSFSKGMTQRAGIAAAIIHDPGLVIFDEPMSGLDPLGRKMVFDLIKDLQSCGSTVLFCSHILSDVERLCDRVVILHEGRVAKVLSHQDLLLAHKATEILLHHRPKVVDLLQRYKLDYKVDGALISCFAEANRFDETLKVLSAEGVDIVTIRASAATLENIFYAIVDKKGE
ncbi:MAG: hypothetical protein B6I36_09620 [Desulfobacteraceae bacterium 4572_35.1]|nr:MAG: hypothetical protein B6I36_09620 [Desulfobacteraceae bacterium 4572_35.1]